MPKQIIIDDDQIVNSTDWENKANKIIEELGKTLFDKLDNEPTESEEMQSEKRGRGRPPALKKTAKFYKNTIKADLQPMQVTAKLNRLLRVYKPLNSVEAKSIQDTEYLKAFGYYCDIISYINEYLVYLSDKQTFCAFCNITTDIYNDFLGDPNYCQVFKSIEDSFVQSNFASAQAGIVDGKVTITKLQTKEAGHDLTRSLESITVNNYNQIDRQEVMTKLAQFNSMVKHIGKGDKK